MEREDADIQTAQLNAAADRLTAIERRREICTHGHHRERPDGTAVCLRCGQEFPTVEAAYEAYEAYL